MKIKETIKKIKIMSKDPRKKALLQLGAWILFFLLSYIIIILLPHPTPNYKSSNDNKKIDAITNFQDMDSFEFTYTFSYLGKEEKIDGTYFHNHYYFTYLNQEYYVQDGNIYKVDSTQKTLSLVTHPILDLSFRELGLESLTTFLKEGTLLEEKEYKDGKKVSSYEYRKDEKKIFLTSTSMKDYIQEIVVDLKEYVSNETVTYDVFQVHLEYREINNLTSYSRNYSDYRILQEEV